MNRLAYTILLLLLVAVGAAALAQQAKAPTQANGSERDEQALSESVEAFVELYNAHKSDEVAALFAPDSRMVFRDGTEVNGRDEIKESFDEAFRASPKSAISVVVDSIRFLTPDVAV